MLQHLCQSAKVNTGNTFIELHLAQNSTVWKQFSDSVQGYFTVLMTIYNGIEILLQKE